MRKELRLLAASLALGLTLAPTALAQSLNAYGSVGYQFLEALRQRDVGKAIGYMRSNGQAMANFRDDKGEGALHIVTAQRNEEWLSYLLSQGGDVNLGNGRGDTPLHIAARTGWSDGADLLIRRRARVDQPNRLGETPLIVAVQQRQLAVIRKLLEAGASADRTDNASGRSARDYAKLDNRSGRDILQLIETVKPKATRPVAGPKL